MTFPFPIRKGYIYQVRDEILRLPPEPEREVHETRRPFLIYSGDPTNNDQSYPVVSGFPLSKSTRYRTEFDVKLAAGEGNVSEKCWVRIHALQPLLKTDLGDCGGKPLTPERMEEIEAQLFRYLDAL
ncbi:type II toxin-antitoxin system PemK/MazF family toxin [Mycobacterium helveticum]|uniref:Type II toxin-antitoxin system PemK/MazF family toxin n=1 Tax=Mycobacterium helveticum TaxID=2592811 RepID=A0A557WWL7_9MYCO|nr:type II toxin-antitoxin system PemK/MazF family toxin [Mycobacterium helveticum]TVS77002.1 type II toxin-antitoxin system PemK/MazF family toxin [Mycobacterium helveticum]TVS77643.1 type II toxin-antitoxin system PemK/MazF family toxin [Mycobacterium helveticum]